VKLIKKLGGKKGASQNLGGAMVHPGPPSAPPLWRYHCSMTYVTRQWISC